jgi:hypothetical protein
MSVLHAVAKAAEFRDFRNFVRKYGFTRYWLSRHGLFVKRDHGPPVEGAASFHTTRLPIVMSPAQGGQTAFREIDEGIHVPCAAPF